jgi:BTB/POZ domain-containing protein KCTD9
MRKSLDDTWRYFEASGYDAPRYPDGRPVIRDAMPSIYDEAPLGLSYFRTKLEDADNNNLTMPRTFFGRSWLVRVNFADTDLSESCMCWNDFDDCDFSRADLSGCDMRASKFSGCKFIGAVLRGADLRRSSFEGCDFTEAELYGAIAEDADFQGCVQDFLSDEQQAMMTWSEERGPEPPGG